MSTTLKEAISAIKSGDKNTGRQLLAQILQSDPQNEVAWLWMSSVVDSDKQRYQCLQRVLAINPNNEMARHGITALQQQGQARVKAVETPTRKIGSE